MLTTKEAAAILGIAARTVKDYCGNGKLRCEKRGRDWFIDQKDLEKFNQERRPRGRPTTKQTKGTQE